MNKNKKVLKLLSIILLLVGLALSSYSRASLTAAVIGSSVPIDTISILGIIFILASGIVFLASGSELERKIKVTSSISKYPSLIRYAEEATENERVQDEMNHLLRELMKGHTTAGLGHLGHVQGTNIFYMRGEKGARLFYRRTENGYEIVGKAAGTGKKVNEEAVIRKLKEIYYH